MEIVVKKLALQVFSCQFSCYRLLQTHHYDISSGAGAIDQTVADMTSGLGLTSPRKNLFIYKDICKINYVESSYIIISMICDIQNDRK
jgi:hypothetical protein